MTDRPTLRILEALGDELERATLADESRERAGLSRRRFRLPGLPVIVLVTALSVTGVAAAATHLFGLAAPVSAPNRADIPVEARPLPSTVTMAGIDAGDPDGLPSWDVRVSRSATGETCTAVGQVQDGVFGILGLDRRFRALPLGVADACGTAPSAAGVQVGARPAAGSTTMSPRTLVVGIAGPQVSRVDLVRSGVPTPIPIGRDRAFLSVLRGLPDTVRPELSIADDSGHTRTLRLSNSGSAEAPDPDGGAPWEILSGAASTFVHLQGRGAVPGRPDTHCIQAKLEIDPATGGTDTSLQQQTTTPIACWPTAGGPLVADIRRMVPSAAASYRLTPARTFVSGFADRTVESLVLAGADGVDRPVPFSRRTGAFVVVLDGRVDPNALRLHATLADGTSTTVRGGTASLIDGYGRTIHPRVDPPWKDLASVRASLGDGSGATKIAGTDQVSATIADPAGGPAWAIHSWRARSIPFPHSGGSQDEVCATVGPLVGTTVHAPAGKAAGVGEPTGRQIRCAPIHPTGSARLGFMAMNNLLSFPVPYVDDPLSRTPHLSRIVLATVVPGAVSAVVERHRDHARTRALVGPLGAMLAMLPPSYAAPGTEVRVHYRLADGHTKTSDWLAYAPAKRPVRARALDPDGGADWAVQSISNREPGVPAFPGQLVDGRLATVDPSTGAVGFSGFGTMGSGRLDRDHPVWFQQQPTLPDINPDEPTLATIQRRTLPGETVIYGGVAPGVRTVTIRTPRDVRTVRPSKTTGLFVVVYDGRFTQGKITVIADGPGRHGLLQKPAVW
ncbi:MAG: hypothetical protein AAGC46_02930 [Solirubrobacteraceae bacterium]|nr:hypothetical protein [Patulibacter sp.]